MANPLKFSPIYLPAWPADRANFLKGRGEILPLRRLGLNTAILLACALFYSKGKKGDYPFRPERGSAVLTSNLRPQKEGGGKGKSLLSHSSWAKEKGGASLTGFLALAYTEIVRRIRTFFHSRRERGGKGKI